MPTICPGCTFAPQTVSSASFSTKLSISVMGKPYPRAEPRSGKENDPVRLNAFLARAGVASRRGADELIREGRVRVNGERGELSTVVGARDVVEVDGRRVERQPLAYVLLNKPKGVVTTASDPQGRPTVV